MNPPPRMKSFFQWKILNAADYRVPQKRTRLILIGSRIVDSQRNIQEIRFKVPISCKGK